MKYAIRGETLILEKRRVDSVKLLENECNIIVVYGDRIYHKVTPCNRRLVILYDFDEKKARLVNWENVSKELSLHKIKTDIVGVNKIRANKVLLKEIERYKSISNRLLNMSYTSLLSMRERIVYPRIRLLIEDVGRTSKLQHIPIIRIEDLFITIDYDKDYRKTISLPRRTLSLYLTRDIPITSLRKHNIRYEVRKNYIRVYEYDVFKVINIIKQGVIE